MKQITEKFTGKKVLVAEDYLVNQEVTQDILELMDVEVRIAENGKEVLDKCETDQYDLILMDIQMPEMDGYQACRELRKRGSEIPIIALTANALPGDREKCIESGMDDYISKPIEASKLEEVLKKYLKN